MAAELPINIYGLDNKAIDIYSRHVKLIDKLDSYILFADRDLIPDLIELAELVRKTQKQPPSVTVYRGFGSWKYQEDLGAKNMSVGDTGTIVSSDKVISTTTSLEIAQAFGNNIVQIQLKASEQNYLTVTDELSYLICKRRNLTQAVTQREIIILPPLSISYQLIIKRQKGLFW